MADDFVLLSWCGCLLTSSALILTLWRWRFLAVKPSMVAIVSHHTFIQWAATLNAAEVAEFLPDPWSFAILVHGFPLVGLLVSVWTSRRSARTVWRRLVQPHTIDGLARRRALLALGSGATAVVGVYLSQVPLTSTGLYTILSDPTYSSLAREESLKFLDNVLIRYAYFMHLSALAPALAVLLAEAAADAWRHRRFGRTAFAIAGLGAVVVSASLTGARSPAALIGLTVLLAWLLRRGLPLNPAYLLLGLALCAAPVALTLQRAGSEINLANFGAMLLSFVVERVLDSPMRTALWFTHHAQTEGFFGVAGVEKLAALLGVVPVNAPNVIGVAYTHYGTSTHANTGYVFAYYSYFGMASLPFSLVGLWILDVALSVYRRVGDTFLPACVASVSVVALGFALSEYTTLLFSGGFGPLLAGWWLLDRMCRSRSRAA